MIANPFHKWILNRIDKFRNMIIIVNGPTGSGKTLAALRLGYELSQLNGTNFKVNTNVDFNFGSLLKKMQLEENKRIGTAFVFEEVGSVESGGASIEWQSKINRLFFSFMQTTRAKRRILIFTCPSFSNLQKGARELVHCQLIPERIDYNRNVCQLKLYVLQVNSTTGKIYRKLLRYKKDGKKYKANLIELSLPPQEMIDEYDKMKKEFMNKIEQKIIDQTNKDVEKDNEEIEFAQLVKPGIAAKRLGVDYSTIWNWARNGKLESKRIGGQLLITENAIISMLGGKNP